MDTRTSRGITGDLNAHLQYSAAEALRQGGDASGAMGAGMGAGMGMAMAGQMANQMGAAGPGGPRPAAAPMAPPPPPAEKLWHIAENGKTTGPFSKAQMGRMANDGSMTRATNVWTAGQDGWLPAEDVTELAQLFTVMPPPPPGV
jgi:membrane protease subunit (stomatin/prohibitin family)